jgi:hypothetical protein
MSERIEKTIDITDLAAEVNLTVEEKERIAGAGRAPYRPTFEALEARDMMSASPMAPMAPPSGGAAPQAGHVRILASDAQRAALGPAAATVNTAAFL